MRAVATLAVHIEEYRKVAPQLVIFQESIQGVENLKARVEELEAKLKAAGPNQRHQRPFGARHSNDPRFERLIMQKIAEQDGQLEVREDTPSGEVVDVKIHKLKGPPK